MQPKGGVTLIITVGGGDPSHSNSVDSKKEGCEMIKVPMEALVSETEGGEALSPVIGDVVALDSIEGEVVAVNEDGTAHIQINSAGGVPVEYVGGEVVEEVPVDEAALDAEEAALDAEGDELLAAAEVADEEALY